MICLAPKTSSGFLPIQFAFNQCQLCGVTNRFFCTWTQTFFIAPLWVELYWIYLFVCFILCDWILMYTCTFVGEYCRRAIGVASKRELFNRGPEPGWGCGQGNGHSCPWFVQDYDGSRQVEDEYFQGYDRYFDTVTGSRVPSGIKEVTSVVTRVEPEARPSNGDHTAFESQPTLIILRSSTTVHLMGFSFRFSFLLIWCL